MDRDAAKIDDPGPIPAADSSSDRNQISTSRLSRSSHGPALFTKIKPRASNNPQEGNKLLDSFALDAD